VSICAPVGGRRDRAAIGRDGGQDTQGARQGSIEGLSITGARARDRRAAIARAGKRIVSVDPRYLHIDVGRAATAAEGYRLRVVRRDGAGDELASRTG
jgi:hypothetical protein